MKKKIYILALTFFCLLCSQMSFGQGIDEGDTMDGGNSLLVEGYWGDYNPQLGEIDSWTNDEGHFFKLIENENGDIRIVESYLNSDQECEFKTYRYHDDVEPIITEIYDDILIYCDYFPELCEYVSDSSGGGGSGSVSSNINTINLHNTLTNYTLGYLNISQRNDYYAWVNTQVSSQGIKWFEAADIVTRPWGVGAADGFNFGVLMNSSEVFLREGNEYLFPFNMENAKNLITTGELTGSFLSAAGEVISFDGKTGIDLDYAMVEFEQTKVSAFITEYQNSNGLNDAEMNAILDDISASMWWAIPGTYVSDIMTDYFNGGSDFDFGNYQDRVILGQALIDKLHQ